MAYNKNELITTNSEFILLILISENHDISGYKMKTLIKIRGIREWADIGSTSIYKGLKKLESKGFVESALDLQKKSKGPVGKKYRLTELGQKQLINELKSGLSETRENNPRFKIALSGIDQLQNAAICKLLEKRILFLNSEYQRLKAKKEFVDNKVLKVQMLFDHSLQAIKSESTFTKYLIEHYKKD